MVEKESHFNPPASGKEFIAEQTEQLLSSLTPAQREIVEPVFFKQEPIGNVAQRLKRSVKALKARIRRAGIQPL